MREDNYYQIIVVNRNIIIVYTLLVFDKNT